MQIRHDPTGERRLRRSNDTMTALHYQLAFARHEGGLEALVLADAAGCLVAGAGAWPTCEMLAAYAPLLVDRATILNDTLASSVSSLAQSVNVRPVSVDGSEVFLCARGGGDLVATCMDRAASGCRRILRGEA